MIFDDIPSVFFFRSVLRRLRAKLAGGGASRRPPPGRNVRSTGLARVEKGLGRPKSLVDVWKNPGKIKEDHIEVKCALNSKVGIFEMKGREALSQKKIFGRGVNGLLVGENKFRMSERVIDKKCWYIGA